jgi:hypothetical protein
MASDNANTIQWQTQDGLPNTPESDSDAVVGCQMSLDFPLHGFREHAGHKERGGDPRSRGILPDGSRRVVRIVSMRPGATAIRWGVSNALGFSFARLS